MDKVVKEQQVVVNEDFAHFFAKNNAERLIIDGIIADNPMRITP